MLIRRLSAVLLAFGILLPTLPQPLPAQERRPQMCREILATIKEIKAKHQEKEKYIWKYYKLCMVSETNEAIRRNTSPSRHDRERERLYSTRCPDPMLESLQLRQRNRALIQALIKEYQDQGCDPRGLAEPEAQGRQAPATPPAGQGSKSSSTPPNQKGAGQITPQHLAALTFRPAPDSPVPSRLAERWGDDADDRQKMARLFKEFLEFYQQAARKEGLPYNLAHALTFVIALNYATATGRLLTQEQVQALFQDLVVNLAGDPQSRQWTDRQKQEMYETLVISAMYASSLNSLGEENNEGELVELARKLAREQLTEILGAPLEKLQFTPQGLVISR